MQYIASFTAGICLLKVKNGNTKTKYEICSNVLLFFIRSGVFMINFEQISHFVLVFPFLTLNM